MFSVSSRFGVPLATGLQEYFALDFWENTQGDELLENSVLCQCSPVSRPLMEMLSRRFPLPSTELNLQCIVDLSGQVLGVFSLCDDAVCLNETLLGSPFLSKNRTLELTIDLRLKVLRDTQVICFPCVRDKHVLLVDNVFLEASVLGAAIQSLMLAGARTIQPIAPFILLDAIVPVNKAIFAPRALKVFQSRDELQALLPFLAESSVADVLAKIDGVLEDC